MALFEIHAVDEQIKALPTVSTASGSVATFDTDMTENLLECVCDIMYQQASGTPTPQSPIPITVYNALNLSHSGADTSNPTITNIPFGQTVAKGTLDVLSGKLFIESVGTDLGTLNYTSQASTETYQDFSNNSLSSVIKSPTSSATIINGSCSCFALASRNAQSNDVENNLNTLGVTAAGNIRIITPPNSYATPTDLKTALSSQIFVYELATPLVVQLDSNQVQALLNENNIWCDTNGDTSVKYLLSVGKKIS